MAHFTSVISVKLAVAPVSNITVFDNQEQMTTTIRVCENYK